MQNNISTAVKKVTIEFYDGSVDEISDDYIINQMADLLSQVTEDQLAEVNEFLNLNEERTHV